MGPKTDPSQKYEDLFFAANDLAEDIKETEELGRSLAESPNKTNIFKARISRLDDTFSKFRRTITEAVSLGKTLEKEDDLTELNNLKTTIRDLYYKALSVHLPEDSVNINQSTLDGSSATINSGVKLPAIQIPTFNGDIASWTSFKDTFNVLVHQNTDLSDIQKFYYLKSALEGSAAQTISAITISAEGYNQAWETLFKRYDNKRVQASNYLVKIFNFKPLQRANFKGFEQFSETIIESALAFKTLHLPDPPGFILYTYALRLLDTRTRERFEAECARLQEVPDFDFFADFIHRQFLQWQSVNLTEQRGYQGSSKQIMMAKKNDLNVCPRCRNRHRLYHCPQFIAFTPNERFKVVKQLSLCVNCLTSSHDSSNCGSPRSCKTCKRKHHSLLHFPRPSSPKNTNSPSTKIQKGSQSTSDGNHGSLPIPSLTKNVHLASTPASMSDILLGTALARIQDISGNYQTIRMIIDSCAQGSFITAECANRLGLPRTRNPYVLKGFANSPITGGKFQINCTLKPNNANQPILTTKAVIIPSISNKMPTHSLPAEVKDHYAQYNLADSSFGEPGPVDFLLGADLFGQIVTGEKSYTPEKMPCALHSIFGWIILGPFNYACKNTRPSETVLMASTDDIETTSLCDIMQRFWEVEEVPTVSRQDPLDIACETHFLSTHTREKDGRYVVRLPFRSEAVELGDSYHMALHRLQRLEMKLKNNSPLKEEYDSVLREYMRLGYISLAKVPGKYFLPHHGVIKDSTSTKLRIVFDASAQTSSGSLNEKLLPGPKLQLDIREVLLNFRLYPVALTADICQMFLQIWVDPRDRCYQHFLYRYDQTESVQQFEISRVTFGFTCSPFLAIRILQQLNYDEGDEYPLASRALKQNIYVDDILTGAQTIREAQELKTQLSSLLAKGGFQLKKWASNSEELLSNNSLEAQEGPLSLSNLEESSVKILGMQWDAKNDCLSYRVQPVKFVGTKRNIMSCIARMYDPLGYLAPVIFKAKTILQSLWRNKLTWDEPITNGEILKEWKLIYDGLPSLTSIQIPRCIFSNGISALSVVGFADASQSGYAAVIYLRVADKKGEVETRLITAKTRLAPLKFLSIARLELCAALLLVRTLESIKNFLNQFKINNFFLLTDSKTVLSWLRIPAYRLKVFIANRVGAILDYLPVNNWYYVCSEENAADVASRGILPPLLKQQSSWWYGPRWLNEEPKTWPISQTFDPCLVPELRPTAKIMTISTHSTLLEDIQRFSSFGKLIRVVGHILRFVTNCRLPSEKRKFSPLQGRDLENATRIVIKATQANHFKTETPSANTNLQALSPFIDKWGILRVGGRLTNSPLEYEAKHPILLPPKAHLTNLIIDFYHHTYLHAGPQLLLSLLQRRYWIISARRIVRARVHKCPKCHRFRAKNFTPFMADLPKSRFEQGRPFVNTGIDFAGPFITKETSRKRATQHKTYVCLFICLSTKAVHLELISQLTTKAFLAGLDRFMGRRGLPQKIITDHGTNFMGAARRLKELYTWYNTSSTQDHITNYLSHHQIIWEFIPPAAPHFGGLWEAGVKSFKYHLVRVLKDRILTFEEFNTLIIRIEAILNSRPLHPISSTPSDYDTLTPGHFLIGGPLVAAPEHDLLDVPDNRLERWQLLSKSIQDIWKRWRYDYLNTLQNRVKWKTRTPNIEPKTLVLLKDPSVPPLAWPAGRVVDVFPGPDGVIRVVKIRTPKGEYIRPVNKLVPLLPSE